MTRADRIRSLLEQTFSPVHLEVVNESGMHSVPAGSETHFKVAIASEIFEGKTRVQRHRAVNDLLRSELQSGLHALSLTTFSPSEWAKNPAIQASPQCLGGSKKS